MMTVYQTRRFIKLIIPHVSFHVRLTMDDVNLMFGLLADDGEMLDSEYDQYVSNQSNPSKE